MIEPLKVVFVGDGYVGKTCLITSYTSGQFPTNYVPTVASDCLQDILVDNRSIRLHLWDTAGQEEYDRLRPLSYSDTDVFLVCFSVDLRSSLANVRDRWCPELVHYKPGVPIVLVATKTDLRTDPETIERMKKQKATIVSTEEGKAMAREISARKYVECSAQLRQGLDSVFTEVVRAHWSAKGVGAKKQKDKRSGCSLF